MEYAALESTLYFPFAVNDTSGSGVDGTTPLFDIRLGGAAASAAPVLSGTPDLLTHVNYGPGAYEVAVAATTGNGFAAGNTYTVYVTLTADAQTPAAAIGKFRLGPVESDLIQMGGVAQSATDLKDFADEGYDPGTNKVTGVVTVDTTTTNTDMRGTDSALLASSAPTNFGDLSITVTTGRVDVAAVAGTTQTANDIGADANTLVTQIGTAGAGLTDLGGMSTAMKAEVNTEALDVLNTDTFAEPAQGAPAATASLATKIGFLYKAWRNKSTQTATTYSLYNDDTSTVDHKATVSDDTTTATKGEVATGP